MTWLFVFVTSFLLPTPISPHGPVAQTRGGGGEFRLPLS